MPYTIRKMPKSRLYKVYSHGHSHSKKGLTYDKARKQMIAIVLSEQRSHPKLSFKDLVKKPYKRSSKRSSKRSNLKVSFKRS